MTQSEFGYTDTAQPALEKKTATGGLVAGAAIGALSGKNPLARLRRGAKLGALGAMLGFAGGVGYKMGRKDKGVVV